MVYTFPKSSPMPPRTVTIDAADAIDLSSGKLIVSAILYARTGTTDTLSTVNGLRTGQWVVLRPDSGDTITIDVSGGNIRNSIDTNITLDGTDDRWVGEYDGTNLVELPSF